jgi:hypothetical protein
MTTTKTAPDAITARRAEYEARASHVAKLGDETKALRERVDTLNHEIPAAIGEGRDASALKLERAEAEAQLRDMESASRVAHARQEQADRELARCEVPVLKAELELESAEFRRLVRECHASARRIMEKRSHAIQRFNRASIGGTESADHPLRALKLGSLGGRVYREIAEVSAVPADAESE